jgi:hypothetical protein
LEAVVALLVGAEVVAVELVVVPETLPVPQPAPATLTTPTTTPVPAKRRSLQPKRPALAREFWLRS